MRAKDKTRIKSLAMRIHLNPNKEYLFILRGKNSKQQRDFH